MAATLNTPPVSPILAGNDNWIEVETDLVNTAAQGYVNIVSQSPGEPAIGEELTIQWSGKSVTFTVAATTNSTATAIPVRNIGETLDEYAERMAEVFQQNGTIADDFHITVHSTGRVTLKAKTAGILDITVTEDMTSTALTTVDGTDPNTEPNLAAQVQVWKPSGFLSLPDTLITTLHATYDTISEPITQINLVDLFPVKPHLPNTAHIDPGIFLSWLRGVATDSYCEYYLRYADKYGTPAVPEALVKSANNYFAIHGAHSADREAFSAAAFADVLHNYRRADGGTFWKPLGDGMPDWVYIWPKSYISGCNVEWTILWDDGSSTVELYGGSPFTMDANKAYYIRSSPLNFNFTPTTPGAIPWYITFRLFGTIEGAEEDLATVKYKAVIGTSWERYLIFDNGVGGCEAVLFNGKGKEAFSGKREAARLTRTSDFSIAEGEFTSFNPEGQKVYELNTGWIEKWYAEHLRQLLLGDIWMIDVDNERFIKMICESDSIETSINDQQLFAISIKLRVAWVDKASNV